MNGFILILVICIFSIINTETIPIINFSYVNCPKGTSEFIYEFKEPNIPGKEYGFFLFRFSSYSNIEFKIRDENNKETQVYITSYNIELYRLPNLKPQNYTFIIKNNNKDTIKMRFFDNTKEININLDNFNVFANLNIKTNNAVNLPNPFIFNFEELPGNPIISYKGLSNNNYIIQDGEYLMNYCEINEDICDYKEVYSNITLEKGKKYKIKINSYMDNSTNLYFFNFEIVTTLLKEVEYGFTEFYAVQNINYYFFIINITGQENVYFYLKHNHPDIHYKLISEEEKNNSINEFKYNMNSGSPNQTIKINNNDKDYLILRIKYYSFSYNGFVLFMNYIDTLNTEKIFEIGKGKYGIIEMKNLKDDIYIISSSKKCMAIYSKGLPSKSFESILFLNQKNSSSIVVDTMQEKTKFFYYKYQDNKEESNKIKYELKIYNNLDNIISNFGLDSIFLRRSSHTVDFVNYIFYLFDIDKEYYLYIKKYFGGNDFYQYTKELNAYTNISQFRTVKPAYPNEYKLINNDLLIISGFQMFSFYNYYGSLFDLYLQKVNDSQRIEINPKMFNYNNLVKLLIKNQPYYLDFTVDHLIKLDKKFSNATILFKDKNGKEYLLSKTNRIITNLTGDNITIISNENVLIYFYKRIENDSTIFSMEFDKSQKGKNMKFNITSINDETKNIYILKDFSFKGYYPMIEDISSDKYVFKNNQTTIYIDNWYDKLENDLDDNGEERFIIYILDFNSSNFIISEPIYIDNLLSKRNIYNFEVIPPKEEGSLIISTLGTHNIEYQFMICKNKEVELKIENSLNYFSDVYQEKSESYTKIINKKEDDFYLLLYYMYETKMTLFHSFKSDNEFIFFYSFDNYYLCYKNSDSSILSINYKQENKIHMLLDKGFDLCSSFYNIIISKSDNMNNYRTFSNPCYLSKLFLEKNDSIKITTKDDYLFENGKVSFDIDVSEFKTNEEIIIGVISNNIYRSNGLNFYSPIKYKIGENPVVEFKLGELVKYNYKTNNYFKLEYNHKSDGPAKITFNFFRYQSFILFVIDGENKEEIIGDNELVNITLTKSGTYYFQIFDRFNTIDYNGKFMAFIPGGYIDTIDLSKKNIIRNKKLK